jgi:SAM-dependent methyltransferase
MGRLVFDSESGTDTPATMPAPIVPWRLLKLVPAPLRGPLHQLWGSECAACGKHAVTARRRALSSELIAAWELPRDWVEHFERREGVLCSACGSSARVQQLASVVAAECARRLELPRSSLAELARGSAFHRLAVAEINPCGKLHQFLALHPRLSFSDYGSTTARSEDLQALSYGDATFDLVLTSDTLEHIPDIWLAFAEIRRVLKPGGVHVFTIPVVSDRPTRARAVIEDGRTRHLLPPSYHGSPGTSSDDRLVFLEAGGDFAQLAQGRGFPLEIHADPLNPSLVTFIFRRAS